MIQALHIKNFKAYGPIQRIPLKPLTLIYGPNSAGKSSILHALAFAKRALPTGNPDITVVEIDDHKINLGGFGRIVHGQQDDASIELHFEVPVQLAKGISVFRIAYEFGCLTLSSSRSKNVSKRSSLKVPVCLSATAWENGVPLARVVAKNKHLTYRRFDPGAQNLTCALRSKFYIQTDKTVSYQVPAPTDPQGFDQLHSSIQVSEANQVVWNNYQTSLPDSSRESNWFYALWSWAPEYMERIALGMPTKFESELEGYPCDLHQPAKMEVIDLGPWDDASGKADSATYLRDTIVGSEQIVTLEILAALSSLRYIGPVRPLPTRIIFDPEAGITNPSSQTARAWHWLLRSPKVRSKINAWLSDPNKLATPYKFVARKFAANIQSQFLALVDRRTGVTVSPLDVGAGISQMIPILVSAYATSNTLHLVEQPEIHLHPALQAELADVFIESALGASKNMFILETHSEHLLLRVMRRIRETKNGLLPAGLPKIRPEDVAVLYVEPDRSYSIVREMPLDADGELIKPWPKGFFEEGLNEVFAGYLPAEPSS